VKLNLIKIFFLSIGSDTS